MNGARLSDELSQKLYLPLEIINSMDLHDLINHPEASIVDVRTPGEFNEGHLQGTVNIPLDEVEERLDEFRQFSTP